MRVFIPLRKNNKPRIFKMKNNACNAALTKKIVSRIFIIFVSASLINYFWEIGQKPFFQVEAGFGEFAIHCIVPSLGDGLILLIIYTVGLFVFRKLDWSDHPGLAGYALILLTGFVIAVAIEWYATHVLGRWSYSLRMPHFPWLNIGFVPVLQMLILPPIIFRFTAWRLHRNSKPVA